MAGRKDQMDELDELAARFPLIAASPRMGRSRDELGTGVRSHAVGNYVIFYRENKSGVAILRVLHGARDMARQIE